MGSINPLYPVFFRMDKLKMLIVGGGEVGHEKLHFILKSSPNANITVIAPWVGVEVKQILNSNQYNVRWVEKEFDHADIQGHDLVVAATNIPEVNLAVHTAGKAEGKIVNIADTPDLCDFYMGSIITRGDLKVAISTNGKSPTLAKRMRQILEEALPNSTSALVNNLKYLRDKMTGDFNYKVERLNEITQSLVEERTTI